MKGDYTCRQRVALSLLSIRKQLQTFILLFYNNSELIVKEISLPVFLNSYRICLLGTIFLSALIHTYFAVELTEAKAGL